jgi:hypothetical protein
MRRLCIENSCSYPGRSVQRAVRRPRGAGLRPNSKALESPPNPKGLVVTKGAGLRATLKRGGIATKPYGDPSSAPGGNVGREGRKSGDGIVAKRSP